MSPRLIAQMAVFLQEQEVAIQMGELPIIVVKQATSPATAAKLLAMKRAMPVMYTAVMQQMNAVQVDTPMQLVIRPDPIQQPVALQATIPLYLQRIVLMGQSLTIMIVYRGDLPIGPATMEIPPEAMLIRIAIMEI